MYKPSTSTKILKSNHSLNKITQPTRSTEIANTKAKGKENNSYSSKSPKGKLNCAISHHFSYGRIYITNELFSVTDLQAQSNIRTYATKITGTSSSKEAESGTSVPRVTA